MKESCTFSPGAGRIVPRSAGLPGRNAVFPASSWALLAALVAWSSTGLALADSQTNQATRRVDSFELTDQYGQRHHCRFPKTNLSFVTVADRKGSKQVESWVQPARQRYGTQIDIEGVADVSSVPRPLRGLVTGKFKKATDHPVMLDWTGAVCRQFAYRRGQVNVFVLDRQGHILNRWAGLANERVLAELFAELDRAKP